MISTTRSDIPATRGECESGVRPCPYASCKWHLIHDHDREGNLRLNFDDIDQMNETCTLDVASHGGSSIEEIAGYMGRNTTVIGNAEQSALIKLRRRKNAY